MCALIVTKKQVYYTCSIKLHPSSGVFEFKSQKENFSGTFLILFDFRGGTETGKSFLLEPKYF